MSGAISSASTGLILQPTYRVRDGRPVVRLFGRLIGGAPFLVEDDRERPYFFVHAGAAAEQVRRLASRDPVEVEDDTTGLTDLAGTPVARVYTVLPADAAALRDRAAGIGVATFEADIRFAYRYLIDRGVLAGVRIAGAVESAPGGLALFRNPEISPADVKPELTALSLDIETMRDGRHLLSIALAGDAVEEVHLVARGHTSVPGATLHADEHSLLTTFLERVRAIDPDLLIGWNVVDFDLRVLARRCRELGIPCALGRTEDEIGFATDRTFTRQGRADVAGRAVLDGAGLVRDALRFEDYRLDTVARAVLGRGKLIDRDVPNAAVEIERLYRDDPAALVAYNLEDARLARDILAHEGLIDLTVERSLATGMPLDRVGASIASFDRLYLPELRRRGVVAPNVAADRELVPVAGGALLDSVPGLFRNVAVFDFKSLYPSLIRTFHLDPLAHAHASDDAIVAPNGARFSRAEAILPERIEALMARREAAKARGARHADQAIKILMNSLFGVLGATACRFFDPDVANAITLFGQQILGWTAEAFREEGVAVLYGDTDSVFVQLEVATASEAMRRATELRASVEARVAERIRVSHGVEPRLTLELEHVLDRFFLPRVRGGGGGSKKRYAGWVGGKLLVVGLESVRRDWPALARRLQTGMLERLFTEREVEPLVREITQQVRAGDLDGELVYVKRIRKGALDRYTATTPPHVQAARKAGKAASGGGVIRYVITRDGPEPVLPGHSFPAHVDREHYVDKILRPIADAILTEVGSSFAEAVGEARQLTLL